MTAMAHRRRFPYVRPQAVHSLAESLLSTLALLLAVVAVVMALAFAGSPQ